MKQPLTPKLLEVFTWIGAYIEDKGYAPTYPEMATEFEVNVHTVQWYIDSLVERNWLIKFPRKTRGLALNLKGKYAKQK